MSDVQRKGNRRILADANNERSYQTGGALKGLKRIAKGVASSAPDFKFDPSKPKKKKKNTSKMPSSSTKPKSTKMPSSSTKPKDTKMTSSKNYQMGGAIKAGMKAGKKIADKVTGRTQERKNPRTERSTSKAENRKKKSTSRRIGRIKSEKFQSGGVTPLPRMGGNYSIRALPGGGGYEMPQGMRGDSIHPDVSSFPVGSDRDYTARMDSLFRHAKPVQMPQYVSPSDTGIQSVRMPQYVSPSDTGIQSVRMPEYQLPEYQMGGVMRWLKKQGPQMGAAGKAYFKKNFPDVYNKYWGVPTTIPKGGVPATVPKGGGVPAVIPKGGVPATVPKGGVPAVVPKRGPTDIVPMPGPVGPQAGGRKKYPWWLLPIAGAGIYEATRGEEGVEGSDPQGPDTLPGHQGIVTPMPAPLDIEEGVAQDPDIGIEEGGAPATHLPFDISFMEAREAGLPEFWWTGPDGVKRRYHTRTEEEEAMRISQEESMAAGPFTMDPRGLELPIDATLAGPAPDVETLAENLAGRTGKGRRQYYRNDRQENRKGARILYDKGTGDRKTSRTKARRDRKELKKEVRGIRKGDSQENKASRKENRQTRKADKKSRKNEDK